MPVAKTYQKYSVIGEPYKEKGKAYIKIDYKGTEKAVRWYSDNEYAKLYPTETKVATPTIDKNSKYYRPQKDVLGFEEGYIHLLRGVNEDNEEFVRASKARYTRWWGWYWPSCEKLPPVYPYGIEFIKLDWDKVSADGERLLPEGQVERAVSSVLYKPTNSEHQGKVGERLDLILKVNKAIKIETNYGTSTMHVMSDYDGNTYIWSTTSKTLTVDNEYEVRGTVKAHSEYHGDKQTILTRCTIKE